MNWRLTRSGRLCAAGLAIVVRHGFPRRFAPRMPLLAHQPGDPVTSDLLALALELVPHARVAVALEVLLVHGPDPGE